MIQVSSLCKEFGNLVAVKDLNLAIPKGEIYGLIGQNGAGKTTTIRMMCGLLAPTTGHIEIAGANVSSAPENARQHIGYLSDFFAVYDDLTVREYLDYFARAYKLPEKEIASRVREVIVEMDLAVKSDSIIAGLSRGMKQRLGIARAIIHKPDVLLLDEPASGLDPKARFELRILLQKLRDQGATILISSHILTELEGFCTSIGIMEKGRLVSSGRIEDVTAAASPQRSMKVSWVGPAGNLLAALANFSSVSNVSYDRNEACFEHSGIPEELAAILSSLIAAGVQVVSFTATKATVEELYMKLSGHEVV